MTTNPNEPISPNPLSGEQVFYGLTKREDFAARLMAAIIAFDPTIDTERGMAALAVGYADALIAELNQP